MFSPEASSQLKEVPSSSSLQGHVRITTHPTGMKPSPPLRCSSR